MASAPALIFDVICQCFHILSTHLILQLLTDCDCGNHQHQLDLLSVLQAKVQEHRAQAGGKYIYTLYYFPPELHYMYWQRSTNLMHD